MALRWYSTVVDCHDVSAQANWWATALGWKKAYEAGDEVVLVPQHATLELLQSLPWEQVPPGLVFVPVPEGKVVKNRLHLDLAPHHRRPRRRDRPAHLRRCHSGGRRAGRLGHLGGSRRS